MRIKSPKYQLQVDYMSDESSDSDEEEEEKADAKGEEIISLPISDKPL